MKRFFFSIIALAAAAVSCTQSALLETPELDGTPVSFSPYTGRTPVTKATEVVGEAGLHSAGGFQVYGFLDDGSVYTGLDNINVYMKNGLWTYDNIVYWPSDSDLSFVAYSANGINKGLDVSKDGFTFTVDQDIDKQIDLLATAYQEKVKASSPNGVVSLTFHHLLSRIGFKVQTTTSKMITITDLSLKGRIHEQGTLDFDAVKGADAIPVLNTSGQRPEDPVEYVYVENGTTTFTANGQVTPRVPRTGSDYLMIIPQTVLGNDNPADDLCIEVKYMIDGSNTPKTSTVKLPAGFEFKAGKAYEFVLQISTSSISFNVQEEEWDDDIDGDDIEDDSVEVGPLEPDEPESEEPEYDVPEESAREKELGLSIHLLSYDYETNVATFIYNVTKNTYNSANITQLKMKIRNTSGAWASTSVFVTATPIPLGAGIIKVTGENDNSDGRADITSKRVVRGNAEIKYCLQTNNSTLNGYLDNDDVVKKFSATASIKPTTPTDPTVTLSIADAGITKNSVTVSGSYVAGIKGDGTTDQVLKYGFCWMTGAGTPTLLNHHYEVPSAGDLTYTVTGLSHYTEYSFCSYVITETGKTCYSAPRTVRTKPELNDQDNNGGDWGNGGGATIE